MTRCATSSFKGEKLVGLDIADHHIAAAQAHVNRHGEVVVRRAGWVDHSPDASTADTVAALRALWRHSGLHTYTVCSCLRSPSLTLKYFSYPALSDGDLESALLLEAEQTLQRSREELSVDWQLNPPESKDEGPATVGGTLIAVPRESVTRHLELLREAGLYPVILDVGCMAACNLFLAIRGPLYARSVTAIIHLSACTADIAILSEGPSVYPRTFFASGPWEDSIDYLVTNITDELRYYEFKLRRRPVERLVFTGRIPSSGHRDDEDGPTPGAPLIREERLLSMVQKATGLPVELWDPLQNITLRNRTARAALKANPDIGPLLSVSLGLSLREH